MSRCSRGSYIINGCVSVLAKRNLDLGQQLLMSDLAQGRKQQELRIAHEAAYHSALANSKEARQCCAQLENAE